MLLEILTQFPGLASQVQILSFRHDEVLQTYTLKASLILKDASHLMIRDYLFTDGTRKYSYPWQTSTGELLGRWDNVPHWPAISTFPHHYHPSEGTAESSEVRLLAHAIAKIAARMAP